MTKTLTEAAPQAEHGDIDVQTVDPRRANQRKRRNLLIAVAVLAVAVVAALLAGPALLGSPPAPDSQNAMTADQIIPLVVLVIMFIVATKWPVNIGVMGLVAAFGVA